MNREYNSLIDKNNQMRLEIYLWVPQEKSLFIDLLEDFEDRTQRMHNN